MDSLTRCDLAAHSDFPCGGLVRTEWYGERDVDVCESHRQRILNDLQRDNDDYQDEALAAWNSR